jgi:2-iminobutanoate/2-iminopropanoate deaminase
MKTILILLLTTCTTLAGAADRKFIGADQSNNLPFSEGVLVGDTLYIAGHLGLDAKTQKPPAEAEAEARLVMDGIKQTVEAAGMTMDDIVMIQIHCPDLSLYDTFNKVYRVYFTGKFPARAFLGSGKLLRDARFEALGIAVKRKS